MWFQVMMSVSGYIPLFHLCVFVTCLWLYITISKVHIFKRCLCFRSLARMLNGKLCLVCKTNLISSSSNICRRQLFLSSKCTNRVPGSNMNIFTQSPSSSHKHLPEAADQWEWKTSITDRLLTTRSLKMKQKPANKSAQTLTTCKQGGFSLVHTL